MPLPGFAEPSAAHGQDIFGRIGAFFSGFAFAEQGGGQTAFARMVHDIAQSVFAEARAQTVGIVGDYGVVVGDVFSECQRTI